MVLGEPPHHLPPYMYRYHADSYPTSDAAPATFAAKLHNATSGSGFQATGDAAFLNTWTYKLGAELLTPVSISNYFAVYQDQFQVFSLAASKNSSWVSAFDNFMASC